MADPPDFTHLLARVRLGEEGSRDLLMHRLYEELRELARIQRFRVGAGDTLNTTALVHEAYEKLVACNDEWADRRHFFRMAARVMRQVLMDDIRRRRAAKRGGNAPAMKLDEAWMLPDTQAVEVETLDEALDRLGALDTRQAAIVELRYFVGLTIEETADVLNVSPATVKREWTVARAWLYQAVKLSESVHP